jgi:tRNA-Thr(GGU) m(6)t(6)A37 methyltransferase TsaA
MRVPTVSVRYIVDDVDSAIAFYGRYLGFQEVMHPAPTFAMLARGDLRLVLSAPGGGPGGGQAMPDGSLPHPGGWNRISLEVVDLELEVRELRKSGVHLRSDIVVGVGGKQVVLDDPSGNPVELFEPTLAEARLLGASGNATVEPPGPEQTYDTVAVGWVESPLAHVADAPKQGDDGAPAAAVVFRPGFAEAISNLSVGEEVVLVTWLDRANRNELKTYPGDDLHSPLLGVFSTRSPDRPNPIGLHRVRILAIDGLRMQVDHLEAVDRTPILDVKPVRDAIGER